MGIRGYMEFETHLGPFQSPTRPLLISPLIRSRSLHRRPDLSFSQCLKYCILDSLPHRFMDISRLFLALFYTICLGLLAIRLAHLDYSPAVDSESSVLNATVARAGDILAGAWRAANLDPVVTAVASLMATHGLEARVKVVEEIVGRVISRVSLRGRFLWDR